MKKLRVGIVGASGAVGEEIIKILEEQDFPVQKLFPLASKKSVGKEIIFKNHHIPIQETTHNVFKNMDLVFFSAGGSVSATFVPSAIKSGALVIDNTSHFRMDDNVPLVVPEVNPQDIAQNHGIIANPNCSTIQMVQILSPLHLAFGIKRVDVSTYQAVSGAGKRGMESLINETKSIINDAPIDTTNSIFPHQIAFNLIPHIDIFLENNYTKEEMKMIKETHKIMHTQFEINATCVRVPVLRSHSESISIKFSQEVSPKDIKDILKNAENVVLIDDVSNKSYPMPIIATTTDMTYVGRIRSDYFDKSIIHLFCVADQIRVGAATNAVRIAQKWLQNSHK